MQVFMMIRDKHGHSALTQTKISQTLLNRYNETCFFILFKVKFSYIQLLDLKYTLLICCVALNRNCENVIFESMVNFF